MDNDVAALGAGIAVTARGPYPHLDTRHGRAKHEMRVIPIDQVVAQIVFEVRRLPVAADAACRPDIGVAVGCPFLDLYRDAAIFDITDIAVVQRGRNA